MSYEIKCLGYSDLTEEEKKRIKGDEYNSYISIQIDELPRKIYSDGGEPEDNTFGRDYDWIEDELEIAYQQGRKDGAKTLADFARSFN